MPYVMKSLSEAKCLPRDSICIGSQQADLREERGGGAPMSEGEAPIGMQRQLADEFVQQRDQLRRKCLEAQKLGQQVCH